MKDYINDILKHEKKPISFEKLCQKIEDLIRREKPDFQFSFADEEEVLYCLKNGIVQYEYYENGFGKYTLFNKSCYRVGRFCANRGGDGSVLVNMKHTDSNGHVSSQKQRVSLSKDNCNGSIDGDIVLLNIGGNGQKPRVEKVIERTLGPLTGEIVRKGDQFFVKPIDKRKQNLIIPVGGEHVEGDIVSVQIKDVKSDYTCEGEIIHKFRHKDDPHRDALLEAFSSGMPEGFSEESYQQLESIPTSVREEDKEGRFDFTDWEVFSIDGEDTKDRDDCISLKKLPNGNYLMGVHIADVPHYVPTGSPIHKDAFRKGNSYYFGGCVEPQLPRKLSNGICSLDEGVERLTKTVLMEMTPDGKVVNRSLVRGVIRSQLAMTYEKANELLDEGKVDPKYAPHAETLREMQKLSKVLFKNRVANGSIEFHTKEAEFIHNSVGNAVNVCYRHQGSSEDLIEEFMLAANVNVMEILTELGIPCVYRVHGKPNMDRLKEYLRTLEVLGMPFWFSAEEICQDKKLLQLLVNHVEQAKDLSTMLVTNLVKCMSHAEYSTNLSEHYAAGFEIYGHFTSPIRRLADDTISRIIDECYFEQDPVKRKQNIARWRKDAPTYAIQASKMEKVAEEVQQNVQYLDAAVYMNGFEGQSFEGTVIGISANGLTIQLDNLIEGKVRMKDLPGNYLANPSTCTLVSCDHHENYYLGDRLKLKLESSNKKTKTIEFSVLEKIRENKILDPKNSNLELIQNKDKQKKKKRV